MAKIILFIVVVFQQFKLFPDIALMWQQEVCGILGFASAKSCCWQCPINAALSAGFSGISEAIDAKVFNMFWAEFDLERETVTFSIKTEA